MYQNKFNKYNNKYLNLIKNGGSSRLSRIEFSRGDRFRDVNKNKLGTVSVEREFPTGVFYSVNYDDGSHETSMNQEYMSSDLSLAPIGQERIYRMIHTKEKLLKKAEDSGLEHEIKQAEDALFKALDLKIKFNIEKIELRAY
jgi:hypothetical protein